MLFILNGPGDPVAPTATAALVTLAVGERYLATWLRVARPSWLAYAARHGLDVIVIGYPLDPADSRSPAWQKCLILSQLWSALYKRLVWLDADILTNPTAPSVLASAGPAERVAATLVNDQCSAAEKHLLLERVLKSGWPRRPPMRHGGAFSRETTVRPVSTPPSARWWPPA